MTLREEVDLLRKDLTATKRTLNDLIRRVDNRLDGLHTDNVGDITTTQMAVAELAEMIVDTNSEEV